MSLVIASTTDTQEAVNAAAGISPGKEAPAAPSEAPPPEKEEPEPDGEAEAPDDDEPEQETESQHSKKPNVQRRINQLTREKYQALGELQAAKRQLEQLARAPQQQPAAQNAPPQTAQGEPQESQFERYEDFLRAHTRWTVAQEFQEYRRQEQEQAEAYRQEQQRREFSTRLNAARAEMPDWDSVMEDVQDIKLPVNVQTAIRDHEHAGKLMYELAKHRDELEKIATIAATKSEAAAIRELGKFEARLDLNGTPNKPPPAISKAPPPISPVGQGSTKSTKSPDEMDYQEYKRWRLKNGAK